MPPARRLEKDDVSLHFRKLKLKLTVEHTVATIGVGIGAHFFFFEVILNGNGFSSMHLFVSFNCEIFSDRIECV